MNAAIDYSEHWAPGLQEHLVGTITLPIKTVSEMNKREHFMAKARRAKEARKVAGLACGAPLARFRKGLEDGNDRTVELRLVRVAPRELDDDNLRGALKAVRDGITDALGLPSDRDARLVWGYEQTRGKPKEYAVRVIVTWMPAAG
jgi:hypothetical protein